MSIILVGNIKTVNGCRELTIGQFSLALEMISAFRQIRVAIKMKLIRDDMKELVRGTLFETDKKLFAFLKTVEIEEHATSVTQQMIVCNFVNEARLISEVGSRSLCFSHVIKWTGQYLEHLSGDNKQAFLDGLSQPIAKVFGMKLHQMLSEGIKYASPESFTHRCFKTRLQTLFPYGPERIDRSRVLTARVFEACLAVLVTQHQLLAVPEIIFL